MISLKLWNEANPPKLREIELIEISETYGISMKFEFCGVPLEKWESQKDRLGRFFAKNLKAKITSINSKELKLELLPKTNISETTKDAIE